MDNNTLTSNQYPFFLTVVQRGRQSPLPLRYASFLHTANVASTGDFIVEQKARCGRQSGVALLIGSWNMGESKALGDSGQFFFIKETVCWPYASINSAKYRPPYCTISRHYVVVCHFFLFQYGRSRFWTVL